MNMLALTREEAHAIHDCVVAVIAAGGVRSVDAMEAVLSARKKLMNLPDIKKAQAERESAKEKKA